MNRFWSSLCPLCVLCASVASSLKADPPVLSYLYPAGAQKGTTVPVRVGGLFLYDKCGFEMAGRGVTAPKEVKPIPRIWFEGPVLPFSESSQAEDYPKDMAANVAVAADAPVGPVSARVWTSQGVGSGPLFVIGELPEIVEKEIEGDPIPEDVPTPITVNGRIFPREDLDLWTVKLKKGESVTALAVAGGIRSPLVPKLEMLDESGRVLLESGAVGVADSDASIRFTAPADGSYHVRIGDIRNQGGPAYVYRLTLTTGPVVDAVFPLGGRRGSTTAFTLSGQALPAAPVSVALPTVEGSDYRHRFTLNGQLSNPMRLDLDDLPEFVPPKVVPLAPIPSILNGIVMGHDKPSVWLLSLAKGKKYTLELKARRLGSPLCGVVSVTDAEHKEVARSDGGTDLANDPVVNLQPTADGVYTVRVSERFRNRGGPTFAYRLKVTEGTRVVPDFRLKVPADVLIVPRGTTARLRVTAERLGTCNAPIELSAEGLPPGITLLPSVIPQGQTTADLMLAATTLARVQLANVSITGTVDADVTTLRRKAAVQFPTESTITGDSVAVIAAVPTPFRFDGEFTSATAPRGQVFRRTYKLERETFPAMNEPPPAAAAIAGMVAARSRFDGPVTVKFCDRQFRHLQGVSGEPITVPAGATRFEYGVMLPPWGELGRTSRSQLVAVGVVKDPDGTEHTVSFTSNHQNHQVIAITEPGRLSLELSTPTIRPQIGGTVTIPVRIGRAKGLAGPVVVSLAIPAHWKGVSAESVTIPADADAGVLTVRFAAGSVGPFNLPASVKATLIENGSPVLAEAELEILGK